MEGQSPLRYLSIVEFPSIEQANAWYDSPENAEARGITEAAFRGRVLMFVEGNGDRAPVGSEAGDQIRRATRR